MEKILIDADVILDFFFDRQPFSDDASQILGLCETKVIQGFVTPIMISNIYYILRKTAKHEKIIESLRMLTTIIDIATLDKRTILEALESGFKDFEDALQNFSAQQTEGIHIIVTRNTKDYKTSALSIMTPEIFLKSRR
ncbi:type II toxin-antitoxin system VapC family toxin [Sphingobacterium faecale]|uniref:PIN domain-containing protein n=1 Tax=Sphingobacterium faecale TaxID=2803775 RepID=A0ABS1R6A7_9SPHI|nr:PIN domain-containing protein [Sphingobacterium faecale]MBL1410228.1 PIN domain-containing protein [Sphingobacterium faecale]